MFPESFTPLRIMRPYAQDVHGSGFFVHGIDEPVLDVDPARIEAFEAADPFFESRRRGERILPQQLKQSLCRRRRAGPFQTVDILDGRL